MVEIPADDVLALYASLMSEVKARLISARDTAQSKANATNNIERTFEAEFCYHQLRRSTELVAIAALTAHNPHPEFRTKELVKEYHPDNLFKQLEKLSSRSFPKAAIATGDPDDRILIYLRSKNDAPTRKDIASIYNQSGDKLHSGALRSIVKRRNKDYDFDFILRSLRTLVSLLETHIIQLPDERALLTRLHATSKEDVFVQWLEPDPQKH